MLTKDDLQAISKLIQAEGNALRREMATKSDLKAEREETRKIVEASEKWLGEKIDRETKDIGGLFHETWKFLDAAVAELKAEIHSKRLQQIEERLSRLEKQTGQSTTH